MAKVWPASMSKVLWYLALGVLPPITQGTSVHPQLYKYIPYTYPIHTPIGIDSNAYQCLQHSMNNFKQETSSGTNSARIAIPKLICTPSTFLHTSLIHILPIFYIRVFESFVVVVASLLSSKSTSTVPSCPFVRTAAVSLPYPSAYLHLFQGQVDPFTTIRPHNPSTTSPLGKTEKNTRGVASRPHSIITRREPQTSTRPPATHQTPRK